MDNATNRSLDWLKILTLVLSFFVAILEFANTLLVRFQEGTDLRMISVFGFATFFFISLWIICKSNLKPAWRKGVIIALAIFTPLFTFGVGTWINVPFRVSPRIFPIDRGAVTSYLYEGATDTDVGQGSGYLAVMVDTSKGKVSTSYRLDYTMPNEGFGYAGVALEFSEPQDLSVYSYLELTLSFSDPEARCRLFLKDSFGEDDFVVLGDGALVEAKQEKQTIKISLDNYFSFVSRKYLKEIDIDANTEFVRGYHVVTVSDLRFVKK